MQGAPIPCYGDARTRRRHPADVFVRLRSARPQKGGGLPQLMPCTNRRSVLVSAASRSCPCRSCTATRPILGFRVGAFAYLTDCNRIPDESWPLLDGRRGRSSSTRCATGRTRRTSPSTKRSARRRIGARRAYFTHICHDLPHAATCARLPGGVELAYDGLVLEVGSGLQAQARASVLAARRAACALMDVIHFPDDPATRRPVASAGARARQLRRRCTAATSRSSSACGAAPASAAARPS